MFCSSPSGYLWEDAGGTTHNCARGGRRTGRTDDAHVVTEPERVRTVLTLVENALLAWAGISIHQGENEDLDSTSWVWDVGKVGEVDQRAHAWRGPELPTHLQGLKILGTPLGHPDYVRAHMDRAARDHQTLLDRIPLLQDVQAAWLLLLHCASARANSLVRVVELASAREFCDIHDAILQTRFADVEEVRSFGSLSMVLGGIGLRSAARTSKPAYWASWGDSLAMIRRRHPTVADQLVHQFQGHPETPFLRAAADTRRELVGVMVFEPPSWQAMSHGARPPHRELEDVEPGTVRRGWQHEACSSWQASPEGTFFTHPSAGTGTRQVARWRRGWSGSVRGTNKSGNDAVSSFVQGDSPPTPPPSTPSVGTLVPMWPFTRFSWPSSRRVCTCSMLLRMFWRESAEKPGDAFAPISWCVTWMCRLLMSMTEEGWRSSWTGCPCEEGPNWPSTRRWCVHCTVMALHDDKLPSAMGLHWKPQGGRKKPRTRSSSVPADVHNWWSSLWRLAAGGHLKRDLSSVSLLEHVREVNVLSWGWERSRLGACGGVPCLHVRQLERLHPLCWIWRTVTERMGWPPQHMRWRGPSVRWASWVSLQGWVRVFVSVLCGTDLLPHASAKKKKKEFLSSIHLPTTSLSPHSCTVGPSSRV